MQGHNFLPGNDEHTTFRVISHEKKFSRMIILFKETDRIYVFTRTLAAVRFSALQLKFNCNQY